MLELTDEQKKELLRLARNTIAEEVGREPPHKDLKLEDEVYKNRCGAFVSLHRNEQLRGCIGYIEGIKEIPDTIRDMAKSAAFRDPRFKPLNIIEYDEIDLEISILTPIEPVADINDIVVGRDGLIISRGYHSGLLLPQVPVEQGWDLETFLEHTCYKAGLPGNAWKDGSTKIEKFSALVFSEKEPGLV